MDKIIIAIIGSGAFFTFLQFLISRYDTKKGIIKKIDELGEDIDRHKAIEARNHILRFSDELRNGVHHSEDYFKQIMIDIDTYENYCEEHKDFANGLTVLASEFITEEFRKIYTHGGSGDGKI